MAKNILAAVDLEQDAVHDAILSTVADMAGIHDADVQLIHVIADVPPDVAVDRIVRHDRAGLREERERHLNLVMSELYQNAESLLATGWMIPSMITGLLHVAKNIAPTTSLLL